MQKVELNRENLEKEGYTLRVEEGVTYIEKKEKINHSKYGECFSFFQEKIELDNEGKEILTQTNRLYKKSENKEQDLESNELIFEGEDLTLESITKWLDERGNITAELTINGKVENWIYYDSNKNIKNTIRKDFTNNVEYTNQFEQVNGNSVLIKTMNGKIGEEPTFIAKYNLRGLQTYLSYIEGAVKKTIYTYDDKRSVQEIEEVKVEDNKERVIKQTINYYKSGDISSIEEEDKERGFKKRTHYEESGLIYLVIEEDKERGIKKRIDYDESGECTSILRTIKNSNVLIEEFYKKGKSLPTFKVEGFEIPLDNLDKYKDICKKYNIEPLFEVLEANQPKQDNQYTVKSFIDFFKR